MSEIFEIRYNKMQFTKKKTKTKEKYFIVKSQSLTILK